MNRPVTVHITGSVYGREASPRKDSRHISKMTGRGGGGRGKVLLPPINFIFKLLQQHSTVSIWLFEQLAIRIEGKIRVSFPTGAFAVMNPC